jgi:hypothetical protein
MVVVFAALHTPNPVGRRHRTTQEDALMYRTQAPGARLQQQPPRVANRQQQQSSGSREFQPRRSLSGSPSGQLGEDRDEGIRPYQDKHVEPF